MPAFGRSKKAVDPSDLFVDLVGLVDPVGAQRQRIGRGRRHSQIRRLAIAEILDREGISLRPERIELRELRRLNPRIKAILVTGFGVNTLAKDVIDDGMVGFIQKPYQMTQISEILARALAA